MLFVYGRKVNRMQQNINLFRKPPVAMLLTKTDLQEDCYTNHCNICFLSSSTIDPLSNFLFPSLVSFICNLIYSFFLLFLRLISRIFIFTSLDPILFFIFLRYFILSFFLRLIPSDWHFFHLLYVRRRLLNFLLF